MEACTRPALGRQASAVQFSMQARPMTSCGVCPSFCHVCVFCQNEKKNISSFFSPSGSLPAKLLNRLQAVINTAARLVCHAMKADRITPVLKDLHWLRMQERIQYKLSCVPVFRCQPVRTNFNKSLEWSPDSVWDHRVRQRSSYQLLEGRHWVTERFLSLPPGRWTVYRQQSLLRQPCIHSVEPWKLIYSPHLSHHLSYIVCILS